MFISPAIGSAGSLRALAAAPARFDGIDRRQSPVVGRVDYNAPREVVEAALDVRKRIEEKKKTAPKKDS